MNRIFSDEELNEAWQDGEDATDAMHSVANAGAAKALTQFRDDLRRAIGGVVPHKGGSGGVYEFSPDGSPMADWSYANAVAYSGAVREIFERLDADIADYVDTDD